LLPPRYVQQFWVNVVLPADGRRVSQKRRDPFYNLQCAFSAIFRVFIRRTCGDGFQGVYRTRPGPVVLGSEITLRTLENILVNVSRIQALQLPLFIVILEKFLSGQIFYLLQ